MITLSPLQQGALDGLCGVYATINALSALVPKRLDDQSEHNLFKKIASAVSPWPDVLWNGLSVEALATALEVAVHVAASELHVKIEAERPFRHEAFDGDFDAFFSLLHQYVSCNNVVALVGLSRPWQHWTCATKISQHRVVLRDSVDLHYIDRANCGLHGSEKHYTVDHRLTFIVKRIDY